MKNIEDRPAPKQARAIATRRRLLEATVSVLCERGYAGTTTTHVARAADVSQGALYKHFGTKHRLIAATTEHLFAELIEGFRLAFAAGAAGGDRVATALRELWAIFVTPELYAVLELYIAARTDAKLREALRPVLMVHRGNLMMEARKLFPEAAVQNPRFEQSVDGLLATMQGAALSAAVITEIKDGTEIISFLEYLGKREFEPPYGVV
jgi:AcrR family transcriptional regulator